MLDEIPQEILIQILKRLQVRSLLKCRSVCKSWNSLISTSSFISNQINYSIQSNNKLQSYALVKQKSVPDCKERFILYNDDEDDESFRVFQDLDFPVKDERYLEIVSSCNGLVCLSDSHYARFYLWNPVIRKYLKILSSDSSFVVGFGFDSRKNEYKIVKILNRQGHTKPLVIKIYELGTSAWRSIKIENHPFLNFCYGDRKRTYSKSNLHWLVRIPGKEGSSPGKLAIASFDLGNEQLREIRIPDEISGENNENHLSLVVCGESIALIQHLSWKSDDFSWSLGYYEHCCVWVLKEDGEVQSWRKKYTFGVADYGGLVRVLSLRKNGRILLQIRSSELASCDPETQRVICHGGYPYRSYYKVHTFMESLLLLSCN